MDCKAIIFDLDGTLLDTLTDIADAANRALARHGYPPHPQQAYKWFVGDGSKLLMTRALPEGRRSAHEVDTCLKSFIADYNRHWNRATQPYDGVMELVTALQFRGIKMSVVTNKPHQFTGAMMAHYFQDIAFSAILGQQDGIPKKPHPVQARKALERMGVNADTCLFLGDSAVDMETALRAGMTAVGAGWGFRPADELLAAGADVVLKHPLDLLSMI